MRLIHVVGARPNFVKMAPLYQELEKRSAFKQTILHTGQHFDPEMYQVFFDQFGLPKPEIELGITGGSVNDQLARMLSAIDKILSNLEPSMIVVYGDVTSTLAAALVAVRYSHLLVHVEAGLRSFDNSMPEEINRIVVDRLAHRLYVTEQSGIDHLSTEGVDPGKVVFAGNIMIDSLYRYLSKTSPVTDIEPRLSDINGYGVLTLHRPGNVDNELRLRAIMDGIARVAQQFPIVMPIHPRTRGRCNEFGIALESIEGLILRDPLSYIDMLSLVKNASVVLTDSGGVQEETAALSIPCVTIRDNTERPATITCGANRLVAPHAEAIAGAVAEALKPGSDMSVPPLWDGNTASRIADDLLQQVWAMEHACA
ncbi:non-hydrolyzing UDP-N-acetylglucosamine 2-epimerase [Aestuariirhabdus litorea]|uniref:UDP-N-acetylglucosamine 2-epimerase (Non-hydrolyzing) n=1 Tax=Aestuariirhabdus litorea TaxID=2528527 RepID=A0A3P3VQI0_9GAMM|nr:UDP-N-acetylglucosamine 2-epimerase (non-hydrolyzing) [Aestuariirhabdus litorea]RRJ84587.1 UDP-N-acetylglucosamine 2-epimerase (non-hydrolyzing) [Aestuariirhabdus litorea]RWW97813.1 UDP-N-acetylglucosamine 2-epimerase (non-hydrolyzing) [Endozoicomonadaceae bacterium GTF-13]